MRAQSFLEVHMSAEGDASKRAAARAALDYVVDGAVIGVGTGSTVNFFIEALIPYRNRVRAAVSSSNASTAEAACRRNHGPGPQ